MDLGLKGRTYLVTGGSRGLGFAVAEALAADGANVVIMARNQYQLDAAVSSLRRFGTVLGIQGDIGDPEMAERLPRFAVERFGSIDGALINSGGPPPASSLEVSDDLWQEAFSQGFLGPVRLTRSLADRLQPGGSIALTLSTSVQRPLTKIGISNGLRPGLAMLAREFATQLGPRGIRVNGLLPGRIATGRTAELGEDQVSEAASHLLRTPLRRFGTPDEFGRVGAFLLSPASSYLTGAMIPVDGGLLGAD